LPGLFLCHPVLQPRFGEAASGQPHFESGTVVTSEPQHVVYTRDSAGNEAIYLDGLAAATGNRCGTVDNWDTDHQLSLANEESDDRAWLGALYLVAVYPSEAAATRAAVSLQASAAPELEGAVIITTSTIGRGEDS